MTDKEWVTNKILDNPMFGKVENGLVTKFGPYTIDHIGSEIYPHSESWNLNPLRDGQEAEFWSELKKIIEQTEQDAMLKALEQ